ncbi:hypothetical protein M3Y97_00707500 [Aphelenchoides bicaudatus]|nr:hypothetical protein M3Y97_00707500 [Aphelenchoides bicaudatus]
MLLLLFSTQFLQLISLYVTALPTSEPKDLPPSLHASNKTGDDAFSLNVLWSSIRRRHNHTDLIRPSLCPSPCERLFRARNLEPLFQGMDERAPTNEEMCYCRCPTASPIFFQQTGQCVSKIDGCKRPIRVASAPSDPNSQWAPVIQLPKQGEFIKFPGQILWQESRVKLKQKQGPRCNITRIQLLRQDAEWANATGVLFQLGWSDELNMAGIIWSGGEDEREGLLGALLQIHMNCVGAEANAHCLSLRVSGEIVCPNYSHNSFSDSLNTYRVQTVVIILLAILLFFTSFGYLILWKVRWRIKKSKLISALQMQFLYHMKQEKEKAADYQHHYQIFNVPPGSNLYGQKTGMYQTTNDLIGESQAEMVMHAETAHQNPTLLAKRKLYFSAEFFDSIQNPPQMADQFLQDLRKMIDIAKQRINLRKHVQHLGPIAEEPLEFYQPYMKTSNGTEQEPLSVKSSTTLRFAPLNAEESSPKSTKSVDSGHESSSSNVSQNLNDGRAKEGEHRSRSNSNSSHGRDNSNVKSDSHHERPSSLQIGNQTTSSIQHEFKRPVEMTPPRKLLVPHVPTPNPQSGVNMQGGQTPPSSRIPTINGLSLGQKSPRIGAKHLTLSNQPSLNISTGQKSPNSQRLSPRSTQEEPPPLPPRNPPAQPPKILQQFLVQQNNHPATQQQQNGFQQSKSSEPQNNSIQLSKATEARRKAYAVFPQDAMLKKSLPRRSKKPQQQKPSPTTSNKGGVIETNM